MERLACAPAELSCFLPSFLPCAPPPRPGSAAEYRCDLVLTGAEAVVENGGIVNKLGTYQIALCAKACNKPFYCAAESYKFARLYPLTQKVRGRVVRTPVRERGGVGERERTCGRNAVSQFCTL